MVSVLLGLLVVVVLVGALMAWQGWSAYRSAQDGNVAISEFRSRLLDQDTGGAEAALERAQDETQQARSALGGPLWAGAAALPGVGDDIVAARRLAVTADDVTQGALPAVLTALSYADPREVGIQNGRVELEPLRRASGQLDRAADLLETAKDDATAIRTDGVTDALRTRIEDTQELLGRTSRLSRTAATAGRLLPDMLGGTGSRDYLVLAQNTAEQRSLGGIAGSVVLLRAEDGRLQLLKQTTGSDIPQFAQPVLPLSPAEEALYGRVLGEYIQNVTDTPDFPRAAELVTEMWQREMGGKIDGVAAIDPWALQLLLQAVGPVQTDAGRLTGSNAADRLLVDVYRDFETQDEQNAVFAQAARQVFDRVREFRGDPRALTRALTEGVNQGRVMVWSARREEQAVLEGTALGRTLLDPTPETPRIGVYLKDRIGSKTSSFQRVRVTMAPKTCGTTTEARTRVQVRSEAPRDRDLPPSITGIASRARPGNLRVQIAIYAPPGWTITGVEASDGRRDLVTYKHDGLWAGARDFTLEPGQEKELTVMMGGPALSSDLDIRYTPGTRPANVLVEGSGCS